MKKIKQFLNIVLKLLVALILNLLKMIRKVITISTHLKKAKELNSKLESFRQYIGIVASVEVTWISNNVACNYSEYASWAGEFYDLLYEIERVTRVPLAKSLQVLL